MIGKTIRVKIGDYLEPWEIQEIREKILKRIEETKIENVKVIQGKRNTDLIVTVGERTRDI